jgi:hypothetical protein
MPKGMSRRVASDCALMRIKISVDEKLQEKAVSGINGNRQQSVAIGNLA